MAKEIERKFLVIDDTYKAMFQNRKFIVQGYLSLRKESTVRIRIIDNNAWITIKGVNDGAVRDEWEYAIPVNDAMEMLGRCHEGNIVKKWRYEVLFEGFLWEIDEFAGLHEGLVVAEIELEAENQSFPLPPFIGNEVTGNPAYYNSTLAGN